MGLPSNKGGLLVGGLQYFHGEVFCESQIRFSWDRMDDRAGNFLGYRLRFGCVGFADAQGHLLQTEVLSMPV